MISLVGTLVDTTAGLTQLAVRPSNDERQRARELADSLSRLRVQFLGRQLPTPIQFAGLSNETPGLPLLRELEQTVALIPRCSPRRLPRVTTRLPARRRRLRW